MDGDLKAGDVVRLKSDGRDMSVSTIGDGMTKTGIVCVWMSEEDVPGCHTFTPAVLELVKPSTSDGAGIGPGDVVRLKSGGCQMHVTAVDTMASGSVVCVWQKAGGETKTWSFVRCVLDLVREA